MTIPVITIDGPSGSGKGTIGQMLARHLTWHYLDSGALYRVLTLQALKAHVDLHDEQHLAAMALHLPVRFVDDTTHHRIFLHHNDVTEAIRSEEVSRATSILAASPLIRTNLLARQRALALAPGLVTDGRDMGTVVFPHATYKFFFIASASERAERRYKQLQDSGVAANYDAILIELEARDLRDQTRAVAPLIPAFDADILDTSGMSIDAVFHYVLAKINPKATIL